MQDPHISLHIARHLLLAPGRLVERVWHRQTRLDETFKTCREGSPLVTAVANTSPERVSPETRARPSLWLCDLCQTFIQASTNHFIHPTTRVLKDSDAVHSHRGCGDALLTHLSAPFTLVQGIAAQEVDSRLTPSQSLLGPTRALSRCRQLPIRDRRPIWRPRLRQRCVLRARPLPATRACRQAGRSAL